LTINFFSSTFIALSKQLENTLLWKQRRFQRSHFPITSFCFSKHFRQCNEDLAL